MSYFTDISKIDTNKYWYDETAAESAVRYIETHCYHAEGPLSGTPLLLMEWQKDRIVRPLFGWKEKKVTQIKDAKGNVVKEFNKRKFGTLHMEVPKKSGKGTLTAAIIQMVMDIYDLEQTMQVVGLAWGKDQAKIVWDMVNKSMNASKRARERFKFFRNSIVSNDRTRIYKIWSTEVGSNDGQMPSVILADEIHVHKNADLLDVAEKSTITRADPLIMLTTTAGDNLDGVGFERSEYAKAVARGEINDERLLVCCYCAEQSDDPFNEELWHEVHPMLGVSIPIDTMRTFAERAKVSVAAENSFKRYYLNIWNNTKSQFISDTTWNDSQWEFDIADLVGCECYGGMDLSSNKDITAFSLVFPIDEKLISLNWFFLPEEKSKQSLTDKDVRQYSTWVRDGFIEETPGNTVDYRSVMAKIENLAEIYQIKEIAYDRWNSNVIVGELTEKGFNFVEFGQGWRDMNPATKQLENLVLDKKFNHLGNPVLAWMNRNASVKTDPAGNIKLTKEGGKHKIDGMISNIMAIGLTMRADESGSYLDKNGGEIIFI